MPIGRSFGGMDTVRFEDPKMTGQYPWQGDLGTVWARVKLNFDGSIRMPPFWEIWRVDIVQRPMISMGCDAEVSDVGMELSV
jgi:hypothetical protein